MTKYNFTCPYCGETYEIENYNMGFMDAYEMRCDSCPTTIMVDFYLPPMDMLYSKGLSAIEKALKSCECGGRFQYSAPHRCRSCNEKIKLDEIARQINWPRKPKLGFGPSVALGKIVYSSKIGAWKDASETMNECDESGIKVILEKLKKAFKV